MLLRVLRAWQNRAAVSGQWRSYYVFSRPTTSAASLYLQRAKYNQCRVCANQCPGVRTSGRCRAVRPQRSACAARGIPIRIAPRVDRDVVFLLRCLKSEL